MPTDAVLDPVSQTEAPRMARWTDLLADGRAPVLALLVLGCWVVAADALVVATVMPSVGASFDGYAWFGWATALFLTGLVVATASSAWLAERVGLGKAMASSGAGFAIGCALSAGGPDMAWFLVGRAIQGCAAGWVTGLIYVAMAQIFPPRFLPRVFAILTSVWGVATFAGPLLGGLFADAGAWRGVFWLFAGQGLLFAAACRRLIPDATSRASGTAFPVAPLLLLTLSVGSLASAGIVAGARLAAFFALLGVALLLAAIVCDRMKEGAVLPLRAADPAFPLNAAYLAYFFSTAAGTAFTLYAPTVLQFRAGLSALEAGYLVAIEALAWTVTALAVSGAGARWRPRWIVIGSAAILAGTVITTAATGGGGLLLVGLGAAVLGAGFGFSYAFLGQRVMGAFDEAARSRGSAAIGVARNSGGALGAAVAALAANAAGFGDGLSHANLDRVTGLALGSAIPFALAALVFTSWMVRAGPADTVA